MIDNGILRNSTDRINNNSNNQSSFSDTCFLEQSTVFLDGHVNWQTAYTGAALTLKYAGSTHSGQNTTCGLVYHIIAIMLCVAFESQLNVCMKGNGSHFKN